VASAWPYVNRIPHLGNLVGSILPADVFARFLRLCGEECVFVSGSDEHGTPIEIEATKRGIPPKELTDQMHKKISELFSAWEISFDNYSRTESEVHVNFVRHVYEKLYENGYIFDREVDVLYCPTCNKFLPDRFVEGVCPICGYEGARGDQCEKCGNLLEPTKLIEPRCAICGTPPVVKRVKHWFFDLPKFSEKLRKAIERANHSSNAKSFSLKLIEEGLKPRSVTRDNKWGIPAPFPGAEDKTIYVWMEAVLGYVSATIEHFKRKNLADEWKKYWMDENTKTVFFIGKDNIPFHTIILPALLMATHEDYVMPWRVDASEFLMFEGQPFSKSRGIGIWIDEALEICPADYWRFALLYNRPETKDSDFRVSEFVNTVNSLLANDIGNFVHRVLTFTKRYFGGRVPKASKRSREDEEAELEKRRALSEYKELMFSFKLKDALQRCIDLARFGNRYLNRREPWKLVKSDLEEAGSVLDTALGMVKALCFMLYPFTPNISNEIWKQLGYSDSIDAHSIEEAIEELEVGQELGEVKPIIHKLSKEDVLSKLKSIRS